MSMKKAFNDLKGVWPGEDSLVNLHQNPWHRGEYFTTNADTFGYIGTRDEFEACRKKKWYAWNARGEVPEGVTRVMFRSGEVYEFEDGLAWFHMGHGGDIVAYTCE